MIRDEQHKLVDGNIRHAIYNRSLDMLLSATYPEPADKPTETSQYLQLISSIAIPNYLKQLLKGRLPTPIIKLWIRLATNTLPVRMFQSRIHNIATTYICPLCNDGDEDITHMLNCSGNSDATRKFRYSLTQTLLNPKYKHSLHQFYTLPDYHSLQYWYELLWPNAITRFVQTTTHGPPPTPEHQTPGEINLKKIEEENVPGHTRKLKIQENKHNMVHIQQANISITEQAFWNIIYLYCQEHNTTLETLSRTDRYKTYSKQQCP